MRDLRSLLGIALVHVPLVGLPMLCLHCGDDDSTGPSKSAVPGSDGGTSSGGSNGGVGPGSNPGVPVNYTCKREIHVSPNGNDAKSGSTVDEAKKTISATTKKAEPGDCIKVHTG